MATRQGVGLLAWCAALGLALSAIGTADDAAARRVPEVRPTVTLRLWSAEPLLYQGFRVTLRFRNWTASPLVVFRPGYSGDGGPQYRYEADAPDGTPLAPACTSCLPVGVPAGARWPSDYALVLPPYSTRTIDDEPSFPHPSPGRYLLRCQYAYDPVTPAVVWKTVHGVEVWAGRTNVASATATVVGTARR